MNYIIIILIVLACILLVFHDKKKPSEETLEIQRKKDGFCVLVKNRKYLLFGQKALDSTMFSVA